jgi:type I restriction enzyme S subunit
MIRVVLKDIVEKPITGEWGDEGTSVNVLRTTNFTNEGFIDYTKVVKRDIEQKKIDTKRLHRGDIIIEKSGGSPTQPVGRVVYFDSEEIFLCNNFTAILRPKKEQVFPKYLQYILFVGHQFGLTSAFQNKTTGIINLQLPKYLEGIQIPLPPLPQQQKIANILDAADALRQNDKALIAKYDELTQALFLDMFGDPVSNPKGWEINNFGNVVLNKDSKRIPIKSEDRNLINGIYPYYGASGIIDYVEDFIFEEENLLIGEDGANLISRSSPIAFIASGKYWVNNHAHVIGFNGVALLIYLKYYINSINLEPYITGSAQPKLNRGNMDKIKVSIPPLSLQNQFAERVAVIEEQKAIAQKSLEHSEELFNSLLQKAFKGKLN